MGKMTVHLRGDRQRDYARGLIERAPVDAVVTISEPRRSLDQNAKMWAMLTDLWQWGKENGIVVDEKVVTPEDWKLLMMRAADFPMKRMAGLDGEMFDIGYSSSNLTKSEMSDLIESTYAWGTQRGVRWSEHWADGMAYG